MMDISKMLKSKKFKGFAIGLIALVGVHFLDLSEAEATKVAEQIMMLTIGYVGAQGIADVGKGGKKK